ncbi:L-mandelate dehydrogenase [Aspergillus karnatakaensis]|uniref:FMN-dependent alpha-hydroxy acid dehydrogenase n=1 Tax=Aspergillus karnatakaensis TaxID=1810916 RepID=UPI003CCD8FD1
MSSVLHQGAAALLRHLGEPTSTATADSGISPEGQQRGIPFAEVQKHLTAEDCWVIINGLVYDVTKFLEIHPGGQQAILSSAGQDASKLFSSLHASDALESLPTEACLGPVDPTTLPAQEGTLMEEERVIQAARAEIPPPESFFLLSDFEEWAERVLSKTAWAYYRSAADEERSFNENTNAFRRYFFRPRVLRDMTHGTTETTILGIPSAMPLFISPTAMVKLGHPLGEVNLTQAAGSHGLVQIISSNASCTLEEIFAAREDSDQPLMFQLYLNKDRKASADLLRKVEKLGAKAIVFTVDVAWESKRTLDVRAKAGPILGTPANSSTNSSSASSSSSSGRARPQRKEAGVAQAIGGYQDRNLTWKDISFIREHTKLPIIVKGVQCIEDSNHGGRQADYSPAPIDVLYELRVLRPDLFQKTEIMIDGGIRCGADIVKALALGAKAVGVGRPFLYANGCHGEEGVGRVIEILHEEVTNTMRNIGATRVKELKPEMVGPAGAWSSRKHEV